MRLALLGFLTVAAFAPTHASAAVYYAVQTDISGAQTQIDVAHATSWTFSTGADWVFGGGSFTMKSGPNTAATVSLSIHQGTSSAGAPLASVTLTHAQFCAQTANCQQFVEHDFLFALPVALTAYTTYFVNLTSAAPDQANRQYFIKGASADLTFEDATGAPIPAGYFVTGTTPPTAPGSTQPPANNPVEPFSPSTPGTDSGSAGPTAPPPPTNVPEPGSLVLLGFGLAGLEATRRAGLRSRQVPA